VIYISSDNTDVVKHWDANIKLTTSKQILEDKSDIFNYSVSSSDIFILDVDLFDNVQDILTFLKTLSTSLKVITIRKDLSLAEGTLLVKKGVKSYCHCLIAKTVLRRVIKTVEDGDTWVYPALMSYIIKNINISIESKVDNQILDKLSKKEKEVALLVASGNSNKEIANSLSVALVTIKKHISSIFEKLDIKDRVSLSILINS